MKQTSRRTFIGSGATAAGVLLTAAPASRIMPAVEPARPPIVHHVFFWLNDPDSTGDRDKLVAGLNTLGGIPLIRELYVGILAATEKREVVDASWQVSELMFFSDLHAQASYQQHPLHLEFVKNCSHLWKKVVVYDAMNLYAHIK